MATHSWLDIGFAGMLLVASTLYASTNDGVAVHQEIAAHGCRDHRGRLHPEGTRVDRSVVTGIITMTVVPIWYVCRNGRWIKISRRTLQDLKSVVLTHSGAATLESCVAFGPYSSPAAP
jgi:hypothetical protein